MTKNRIIPASDREWVPLPPHPQYPTMRGTWRLKPGAKAVAAVEPVPCGHLGGPTGEAKLCSTCRGNVLMKLLACSVHGACLTKTKVDGVACCVGCGEYEAKPTEGANDGH